ncbi:MAG: D-alanine--D-alanine ligase [Dehalococcoidia bacterium]|nr:D-alanine--D-alanine ligase [Dehalococcoidia bacterium]
MATQRLRVGVIFGSRSVEHDVSIITAAQAMAAMDRAEYEVIPIYVTREGKWLTGEALTQLDAYRDANGTTRVRPAYISPEPQDGALVQPRSWWQRLARRVQTLRLDVVLPCVHGTHGEDGTLQGLLELANVPYVGAGVVGSAVGMDKIIMKAVFASADLPLLPYLWYQRSQWESQREMMLTQIERDLTYPLFVKPANLGSSIGISQVRNRDELEAGLAVAAQYDRRLLVEQALEGAIEINCSVLGNDDPRPSVCEQPVPWEEFLSYEDKYLRGGGKAAGMASTDRRIPAPISDQLTQRIQAAAVAGFRATDGAGVARVDFLVDEAGEAFYINEINTIPGSLSFYLWEASGLSYPALIDRLIELALERHQDKQRTITTFESNILAHAAGSNLKRGSERADRPGEASH